MIIDYRYAAHGHKPQRVLGHGFILRRSGTDSVGATLVGSWANVITVRAETGPVTARAKTTVEI